MTTPRATEPGASVVVVGSINRDIVVRVPAIPRPGETVLATGVLTGAGGKGANQAVAAANAGAQVTMLGRVGDDEAGRELLATLAAEGVGTAAIRSTPGTPSGTAYVALADGGENAIVVVSGANAALAPDDVDAATIAGAGVVVTQAEIPHAVIDRAVAVAAAAGVPAVLNLAPAVALPPHVLGGVAVLVVNREEGGFLLGGAVETIADAESAVVKLSRLGPAAVVITLGGDGAVWFDGSGSGHVPAPPVDVVDTTGAGDAFVGTLAARLAFGDALPDAVAAAVRHASSVTTVVGARPRDLAKDEEEQ